MEDGTGATTTDGACDVIDVEVEVVSTTTALLLVVAAAGAAGAVDSTTGEVELSTAGDTTCCDQYMEKGFAIILLTSAVGCHCVGLFLFVALFLDDCRKMHGAETNVGNRKRLKSRSSRLYRTIQNAADNRPRELLCRDNVCSFFPGQPLPPLNKAHSGVSSSCQHTMWQRRTRLVLNRERADLRSKVR